MRLIKNSIGMPSSKSDDTLRVIIQSYLGIAFILSLIIMGANPCVSAESKRVLIVTTEQSQMPTMYLNQDGAYIATDLAASGLPFDVVTYGRFVDMDLTNHDVIMLSGHTSPTPVSDVAAKCQLARQQGRKIFVNGDWPFRRYDLTGKQIERVNYACTLFNVIDSGTRSVSGTATVPAAVEKDPTVTAVPLSGSVWPRVYSFRSTPPMTITLSGYAIGFLYPEGGAIDSQHDYFMNILDYGKIALYLRYGSTADVGFANDRIDGHPIVSLEVHSDGINDLVALDKLSELATDCNIPLMTLLILSKLAPSTISKWNTITNPLVGIGSHSRTHQMDWPPIPDVLYETSQAIADQTLIIPRTINYFNFSGNMNPTTAQTEQIYSAGVLFGAGGSDARGWRLPSGQWVIVQRTPTRVDWFRNLAKSTILPFLLSQTLAGDYPTWANHDNYTNEFKKDFDSNVKYGLYTYGIIHDYMLNPSTDYYTNNVHMSVQIRAALDYAKSQDAKFIFTDELILRLRDFIAGWVDYDTLADGSLSVTAYRPGSRVNQVKIQSRNSDTPIASGDCVMSQHLVNDTLYVDLRPETTSTFIVRFRPVTPSAPVLNTPIYTNGNLAANWSIVEGPWIISDYQYAIGTTASNTDVVPWTSAGTNLSVNLNSLPLTHNQTYYFMVKGVTTRGVWSDVTASNPILADLTPPTIQAVNDGGDTQISTTELNAAWAATDPESGIVDYQYAVGTTVGATDIVNWLDAGGATGLNITGLQLIPGQKYYVSVRARNGAGTWGNVGSSDGVLVTTDGKVSSAKKAYDGFVVAISGAYVTVSMNDGIYVEQADRSSGIKVLTTGTYQEGAILNIVGEIRTINGERVITKPDIGNPALGTPLKPLAFSAKSIGGSRFNTYTPGVTGGTGLNNIGLLVATWGKVTYVGDTFFYMDDGSNAQNGSGPVGIKVDAGSFVKPFPNEYVRVTGVVSTEAVGQLIHPVLKMRTQSDISNFGN